jgi:hypothetical protein
MGLIRRLEISNPDFPSVRVIHIEVMTSDTLKKCELLAEEIARILREGIRLGPEAVHFIDSTYANPSFQDLSNILEDESGCDRDTLLELIFFPDESIQARMENLLESLDLGKKEVQGVRERLLQKDRLTTVYFPGTVKPLMIQMPGSAVDQFLTRLNIAKRLDEALVDTVHKNVSENIAALIKVKLRNARKPAVGSKKQFLIAYFEKMKTSDNEIIECLELVLDVLDDREDNADIFNDLMARKKCYFKGLLAADTFAAKLKKTNMEILMAQGQRAPCIHRAEATRKMALIDKVSLSVLGKTRPLERVADGIKIEAQNRAADLRKIIKLLSTN